jgi:hypothetical protein
MCMAVRPGLHGCGCITHSTGAMPPALPVTMAGAGLLPHTWTQICSKPSTHAPGRCASQTGRSSSCGAGPLRGIPGYLSIKPADIGKVLCKLVRPLGALGCLQLAQQRSVLGLLLLAGGLGALGQVGVQQGLRLRCKVT